MNYNQLKSFDLRLVGNKLELILPSDYPLEAGETLSRYVAQTNRLRPIGKHNGGLVFTLYQPPYPSPAGKRELTHRLCRKYLGQRQPTMASLALTYLCHCDCIHCSAAHYRKRNLAPLDTSQWKEVFNQFLDIGASGLNFTGGEPTLHPDLVELVDSVDKNRAAVIMFSCGMDMTKDLARSLADAGLLGIFLSVDSADPQKHDELRQRPGLHSKMLKTVEILQNAGLLVGFSTYMTHDRLVAGEMDKILQLAFRMGVLEVTQFDAMQIGSRMHTEGNGLTEEDRQHLLQLSKRANADPKMPLVTAHSFIICSSSIPCFAGLNQVYLTAFGDLCPCDFTPISFGNIREIPLEEIWAKLTRHPLWQPKLGCRMQDPDFRAQTVDKIPDGADLPYPIEQIEIPVAVSEDKT